MRVACYVDGFNLYHAVAALGDDTLKWLNLASLAESYVRDGETLVRTAFFTALNDWDAEKRRRHVNFITAQQAFGVEVITSRFDKVSKYCHKQGRYCPMREEKQSDVAIATEMLSDCYELGLERIVLVTADSDQIPVVKRIRKTFGSINVYLVAPPKRLSNARELGQACSGVTELTAGRIRQHQLPPEIRDGRGKLVASRPSCYAPHQPMQKAA